MSTKIYDWQKAIDEINLEEFFLHKFPSFYWDASRKAFVDHPDPKQRTDKFTFFKGKDGKQNFIARHSNRGGNLINFIKNHIARGSADWAKIVNKEINEYYPLIDEIQKSDKITRIPKNDIYIPEVSKEFQLLGKLFPLHDSQKKYITDYRKISEKTINSDVFKNVVKSYQPANQKYFCIGIPLYNVESDLVGVNKIYTSENYNTFNTKLFEKGSDNRLGFSKSNRLPDTERFVFCESTWDAMAHYEIHNPSKVEYLISNGEVGISKATAMLDYAKERDINQFEFAHDNDVKGNFFDLLLLSHLIPNLKLKDVNNKTITVSIIEGKEVDMKSLNQLFDKLLELNVFVTNSAKNQDLGHSSASSFIESTDHCLMGRKEGSNEIEFKLPNQKEFIEVFNSFIDMIFLQKTIDFMISKSETKDFNDDLKISKENAKQNMPVFHDINDKELQNGDVIDIKQTVNGNRLFVINDISNLDVRYFYDFDRQYEYDVNELIKPNHFNGQIEFEIVGEYNELIELYHNNMENNNNNDAGLNL